MSGPLHGLRVLDLSRILAGPWATQFLADLGADVIKIERPDSGDDTRHWGPPWLKDDDGDETRESAYFLACNRGKRSVAIDLASPQGQSAIRKLLPHCDVLVENFKPGALHRYRLDYESLRALHPRLIYCSITGFGQTGPNVDRAGYDAMIQAEAGLMSITGDADGTPMKTGVAVADLFTGMYAASSILAALHARDRIGVGQHIDLALHDVQMAMLANQAMNFLVGGKNPERLGNAHPNIVPYQTFAATDGHLMLAVGNDAQFVAFCKVAALDGISADCRFARNADRVQHRDVLLPLIDARMRERTVEAWRTALDAAGVPCSAILGIDQVMHSTQAKAREMLISMPHACRSDMPAVANPVKFSATPIAAVAPPPLLGADTDEVFAQFNLFADDQSRF